MAKKDTKTKTSKAKAAKAAKAKKSSKSASAKATTDKKKAAADKKSVKTKKEVKETKATAVKNSVAKSVKQGLSAVKEKLSKTVSKAKSAPSKVLGKTATLVMSSIESDEDAVVDEGFTAKELDRFKQMLLEHKEVILEKARQMIASGNIEIDRTEMTDEVDLASATIEQNLQFRLMDRDRKLLAEIEHALTKINTGEFGYCEGTGEMIPKRRLELRPWTRHSVKYKEQIERMKKSGRGVFDEDSDAQPG